MNVFSALLAPLLTLYIIGGFGFLAKRMRVLHQDHDALLMRLVLMITLPSLIVASLDTSFSAAILQDFGSLLLLSFLALAAACLLGYVLRRTARLPAPQQPGYEGIIIFGNQGFIGYAVCSILFGQTGIIYATVFNIFYLFLIWTYGIYLFSKNRTAIAHKEIFFNSGVIATAGGLLLFLTPLALPPVLHDAVHMIGSMTAPLSMLIIGSLIGNLSLGTMRRTLAAPYIWIASFVKLLVLPLLLLPVPASTAVLAVALLLTGMPSAPTMTLYALRYGADPVLPAVGTAVSTILSLATLPLLYWLVQL